MSWDAQPPQQPPPEPGEPFVPQGGWTAPAPRNPYEQAPPMFNQPGPYDQQPQPPQYEQTIPYGQYPPQPVAYDQYGQPMPPQPGAAPWGQYNAPGGFYPGPPPKRSRTGLFVGLGIGAGVIAAGVAIGIAVSSSSSTGTPTATGNSSSAVASTGGTPSGSTTASTGTSQTTHTVVVPSSAGSLHLLTNSDTTSRIADLKSKLSSNVVYTNPQIGFYGVGSSSSFSVWLLAEDTTNISSFRDSVASLGVDGAAKEIANAANMTNTETESPGPLGGALLCGTLPENSVNITACEWVDDSSFGWVYFLPTVSHSNAIAYTLDLRGAVEQ